MFCSKCGKEISDDSVFCNSCGSKIEIKKNKDTVDNKSHPSEIKSNQTDSNQEEKKKRKIEFGLVFLLLLYWSISSTWIKNNSNYISSLTVTIIILCVPLLVSLYFLLRKVLLKIKYFLNKVKLSSFVSGLLSIIVVFSIGNYFIRMDKSNNIQEQCSKQCDENYKDCKRNIYCSSSDTVVVSCKSHYNKKLNTCLTLEEKIHENVYHYKSKSKRLYDYIKYKGYGDFNSDNPTCNVIKSTSKSKDEWYKCNSEKEWNSLVKPYMEE